MASTFPTSTNIRMRGYNAEFTETRAACTTTQITITDTENYQAAIVILLGSGSFADDDRRISQADQRRRSGSMK